MSRLPQVKPKEVIKALEKLGFWQIRISGSHLRLIDKDNLGVTVPLHNKPLPFGTLKSIVRQANITTNILIKNL